jgi:hypothetical protein
MPTEPNRPQGAAEDDPPQELPRRPDGPGPKDVPDEEVIDKTLPGQSRGEQPRE